MVRYELLQDNGIKLIGEITEKELASNIEWWVKNYKKINIEKMGGK